MASVNKVILIGNLGRDPETRMTADGRPICSLALATTRRYKDSHNTRRLTVDEVVDKLLSLEYVKEELAALGK